MNWMGYEKLHKQIEFTEDDLAQIRSIYAMFHNCSVGYFLVCV